MDKKIVCSVIIGQPLNNYRFFLCYHYSPYVIWVSPLSGNFMIAEDLCYFVPVFQYRLFVPPVSLRDGRYIRTKR